MENAIRHRISIAFDQDPAKYEALSQRLDTILANYRKDWAELARQLQRLVQDIVDDAQDPSLYRGLAPRTEAPIFALIRTRSGTEDRDVDLAGLATDIVERLRNEAAVQGFWENPVSQEAARRAIVQEVDRLNLFAFEDLDRISSEIMSVARANRSDYAA
jgi:type I restriction enzyme, R subunit